MRVENDEIAVRDLFEGAYLLCRGFELKALTVTNGQGKHLATFLIAGAAVGTASEEYRQGRATVNVAMLKFTLNKLKDAMFAKIRENERREHQNQNEEKPCSAYHEQSA